MTHFWQPMETAPKDGIVVLVGAWRTGRNHTPRNWHCYAARWSRRYHYWGCMPGEIEVEFMYPTHWMPLPEPPREEAQS